MQAHSKARFVYVLDSYHEDNQTKDALDALGLVEDKDYRVVQATVEEAELILAGTPGERPADASCLLVFTGLFGPGGLERPAISFAKKVKEANPAARVYLRSTFGMDTLDPIFDGQIEKGFGNHHSELQSVIRQAFGL